MSFNPPYPPTNGLTYGYGQLIWQYEGTAGVWNIKDGATVGGVGPKGDQGDPGNPGEAGPQGATGATGVVVMASSSVTGVASFNSTYFTVGGNGAVTLASAYQVTGQTVVSGYGINTVVSGNTVTVNNIGVTGFNGLSGNVSMTGAGALVGRGNNTIDARLASASVTGVASFDSTYFAVGGNGVVTLVGTYQGTGQTVVSGGSSQLLNLSGNTVTIDNRIASSSVTGVASFNTAYFAVGGGGAVSLASAYQVTGQTVVSGGGSQTVSSSGNIATIDNRIASSSVTGVASFNTAYFAVGGGGAVSLASAYQVTGQTVVSGGGSQTVSSSGNIATIDNRLASINLTGVASFDPRYFFVGNTGHVKQSGGYDIGIQTKTHQIPFMDAGGTSLSGDPCLLFNGTALTFGGSITKMTITGPSLVLGYSTAITGGIFMTPAESARYTDNGVSNTLTITPTNGTVQRFKIAPTTNVTVEAGTGWHTVAGTTETICVIVQSTNGQTGIFSSNILTSTTKPVLFGTAGGIDVFTVMRVAIDATKGLTMAFQTAKGMTAANFNING